MAQIAYLGTGLLGGAFAEAAAKRGDTVTAWNRTPDKVQALAHFGVKPGATPADAVRGAARVHLILKDDAAVEEVIAAAEKLFGNAMIIGVSAVLADVLTIAKASNVPAEEAIKLLGLLDLNAMVTGRGANMAKGNFTPTFELSMARKDIRLMMETAGTRPLAALPAIAARMDQLIAAGHGDKDTTYIAADAARR